MLYSFTVLWGNLVSETLATGYASFLGYMIMVIMSIVQELANFTLLKLIGSLNYKYVFSSSLSLNHVN